MDDTSDDRLQPLVLLGERIKAAREARGMSQTEVARLLEVAKQTVSQWERGRVPPLITNLVRFAAIVRVDIADLVSGLAVELDQKDKAFKRLHVSQHIVPLFKNEAVAGIYCNPVPKKNLKDMTPEERDNPGPPPPEPEEYTSADKRHRDNDCAFLVQGRAMEPRFKPGDTVTIIRGDTAEPGQYVLAFIGSPRTGTATFRRYIPRQIGTNEGARLVANNSMYPEVVMGADDLILGVMGSHISTHHD